MSLERRTVTRNENPPPVNTELWDYWRTSVNMEWDEWSKYAELQHGLVLDSVSWLNPWIKSYRVIIERRIVFIMPPVRIRRFLSLVSWCLLKHLNHWHLNTLKAPWWCCRPWCLLVKQGMEDLISNHVFLFLFLLCVYIHMCVCVHRHRHDGG